MPAESRKTVARRICNQLVPRLDSTCHQTQTVQVNPCYVRRNKSQYMSAHISSLLELCGPSDDRKDLPQAARRRRGIRTGRVTRTRVLTQAAMSFAGAHLLQCPSPYCRVQAARKDQQDHLLCEASTWICSRLQKTWAFDSCTLIVSYCAEPGFAPGERDAAKQGKASIPKSSA